MGMRRQAREVALQVCYMCDALQNWSEENMQFSLTHFQVPRTISAYALRLCQGIAGKIRDLDSLISIASQHWSINRMNRVDRSLLRIGAFEILYLKDVPLNVAINEAIEIAKRFCDKESPMFINGVLDRIASSSADTVTSDRVAGVSSSSSMMEIEKEQIPSEVVSSEDALPVPEVLAEAVSINKISSEKN